MYVFLIITRSATRDLNKMKRDITFTVLGKHSVSKICNNQFTPSREESVTVLWWDHSLSLLDYDIESI